MSTPSSKPLSLTELDAFTLIRKLQLDIIAVRSYRADEYNAPLLPSVVKAAEDRAEALIAQIQARLSAQT